MGRKGGFNRDDIIRKFVAAVIGSRQTTTTTTVISFFSFELFLVFRFIFFLFSCFFLHINYYDFSLLPLFFSSCFMIKIFPLEIIYTFYT